MKTIEKMKMLVATAKFKVSVLITMISVYACTFNAYADFESDLKKTQLYKGTVDVLKGGAKVLLAMTVLITIALAIGRGIQWQTAEEQEKPMRKKALFNTIGIGVLIATIAGLVSVVLGAYGLKDETNSKLAAQTILTLYHFL